MSVPVTNARQRSSKPRGEDRVRGGHPWVYRSDIADVVDAERRRDRRGARAAQSPARPRAVQRSVADHHPHDLARRDADRRGVLARAARCARSASATRCEINATAFRLVHGEADLLPSLIVDRYDDYLVMQTLSQGMDRLAPTLVKLLAELTGAKGILARNDPKVRKLEGLDQKVEVLYGTVPETISRPRSRHHLHRRSVARPEDRLVPRSAREPGGGRALRTRPDARLFQLQRRLWPGPRARSATSVEALDVSAEAVERITANAAANGIANLTAREANVFDELRHLERDGARYDTIVLDPPAFAKNKAVDSERPGRLQGNQPPGACGCSIRAAS